ncbi:Spy/CpxP family protein refolding chaperone [Bradyrhizobium sp. AUGA SZCCT0283]|uniref:Spy/CpxP family protein refolding chaperone n=1 Tax=Bradyrhizobium sp. AUGA SZCCT0283 TaxID=2807671 RepID=UPI001BAB3051|nr:Spy/CpxP family protein refolding chaperone [Bradyrhizobium sp. AUGA SZCCT0283]MBR1273509.1 Spy/CpxP family protein refolding chaperone [Bradyrhizobium sp. AUGA SZCCT0283]
MTRLTMAAALTVAALAVPAWAQAPAGHDHSHPADSEKSAAAPASPAPAPSPSAGAAPQGGMGMMGGGMGNMPMMGMMKDMKEMMGNMSAMHSIGIMQMMGMMGRGTDGMATIDRIEGRIAFLRAELKITDAQADAWNAFADALRTNARKLTEVRATMMPKPGDGQPASALSARLEQQEQWLAARLDGTKAMKSAFVKLNEVLSDDQKKTANDLLAPHMGMAAMAMMPDQRSPEQKEQGRMPGMGSMGMGKK